MWFVCSTNMLILTCNPSCHKQCGMLIEPETSVKYVWHLCLSLMYCWCGWSPHQTLFTIACVTHVHLQHSKWPYWPVFLPFSKELHCTIIISEDYTPHFTLIALMAFRLACHVHWYKCTIPALCTYPWNLCTWPTGTWPPWPTQPWLVTDILPKMHFKYLCKPQSLMYAAGVRSSEHCIYCLVLSNTSIILTLGHHSDPTDV
jgi:hypothetical protein